MHQWVGWELGVCPKVVVFRAGGLSGRLLGTETLSARAGTGMDDLYILLASEAFTDKQRGNPGIPFVDCIEHMLQADLPTGNIEPHNRAVIFLKA